MSITSAIAHHTVVTVTATFISVVEKKTAVVHVDADNWDFRVLWYRTLF